jgi:hypothetical protein
LFYPAWKQTYRTKTLLWSDEEEEEEEEREKANEEEEELKGKSASTIRKILHAYK